MAKMATGRTAPISGNSGFNFDSYEAGELFTYDHVSFTATRIRAYDNALNDTVVTGAGFRFDANENPMAGTVNTMILRVNGVQEFAITGLSCSLKAFYDLARTGQSQAAWALVFAGNDTLTGTAYNDVLRGYGGNDLLKGGSGADRLYGYAGNDRFHGGDGSDRLNGGSGADRFAYTSPTQGKDVIYGFASDDVLAFEGSAFHLGSYAGVLKSGNFRSRAADNHALDSNDYFVFNRANDTVWYDSDGNGAKAPVLMADFTNDFALTAADLLIV